MWDEIDWDTLCISGLKYIVFIGAWERMVIVISCSSKKNGNLFHYKNKTVKFISNVNKVPNDGNAYVHPDDLIPNEKITWRNLIERQSDGNNLVEAHNLYANDIYNGLNDKYADNLYIFSAGWGIVRARYKLPVYDITFSKGRNIENFTRRSNENTFKDFNHLRELGKNEDILLIAGKDYVLPFCSLTKELPNKKIIVYKSDAVLRNNPFLKDPNFQVFHYQTNRRTTWYYEFARKLINEEINLKGI